MSQETSTDQAWQPETATSSSGVERASAITEELIDRGAPWSARTSWRIVLGEAVVAGILGLAFLFEPFGGSATTLKLIGLILLGGALITSFQLWRHQIRPELELMASFRAGSGVTVGLVVIVATFFAAVTPEVTASLAVVIGIGFIIFGVAGIVAGLVGRTPDQPLPLAGLVANAVLVVTGLMLMFAGASGAGAVDGIFTLLAILLIAAGLGLAGYAYLLYQQEAAGARY